MNYVLHLPEKRKRKPKDYQASSTTSPPPPPQTSPSFRTDGRTAAEQYIIEWVDYEMNTREERMEVNTREACEQSRFSLIWKSAALIYCNQRGNQLFI